jgi:hypothetical protein
MQHPLWPVDGSVVYNCCWASPEQSFSGSSPAGLVTIFYCLRFETPPTWRTRYPYLYPYEQGGPTICPGTGFPFRRLQFSLYKFGMDRIENTASNSSSIIACVSLLWSRNLVAMETCLQSHCLQTVVPFGSMFLVFSGHATILFTTVTRPTIVIARSKARNTFDCSSTGIMGSNATWGMNVFLSVFLLSCVGRGLAMGWFARPRSPTEFL